MSPQEFPVRSYRCDGKRRSFRVHFAMPSDATLEVYIGSHKCEAGWRLEGRAVTFAKPPPEGSIVTLTRHTDIGPSAEIKPATSVRDIAAILDKQCRILQEHGAELQRTTKLGHPAGATKCELPNYEPSRFLKWSAQGPWLENSGMLPGATHFDLIRDADDYVVGLELGRLVVLWGTATTGRSVVRVPLPCGIEQMVYAAGAVDEAGAQVSAQLLTPETEYIRELRFVCRYIDSASLLDQALPMRWLVIGLDQVDIEPEP